MKITHELEQGSRDWHIYRAEHFGASEAAAMLGISKYCTRSELLQRKATGIDPEVSPALQRVFDRGHETEIGGREMAEKIIGQPLYPVTMSEGKLSVSCDGLTLAEDIAFEHKQYNATLADSVRAGVLPEEHHPQCQQVMLVTDAAKLLFMVSDGTPDNCAYMWVIPHTEWRRKITQGWTQFAIDLKNYVPTEATVEPVAAAIEALPALMIQVEGKVLATNLDQFKAAAQTFIANINTDLQTDQHFADADKMVKFLKAGEERLALCKSQALAQTASIDELFRTIDAISGQMADKRIMLGILVAAEKQNRRNDIIRNAQDAMMQHIDGLNKRIGGFMPRTIYPFAEAIKGLKSIDSMRDKVSAALANAKVEANEIADLIAANLAALPEDRRHLFPDFAAVCTKQKDDFDALFSMRVTAEVNRLEAERETIRQEEAERAALAMAATTLRGKADAGVGLPLGDRAQPDKASTPPIRAKEAVAAMHDANDAALITKYIALQDCSPGEKKAMRETIEKWEKYRAKVIAVHRMAAAA